MATRQYIGARYVPKFADPIGWVKENSYEALTIVTYLNNSYTSKKPVPSGIGNPAENPNYWALTGNYNAQVEEYRKDVSGIKEMFFDVKSRMKENVTAEDSLQECITLAEEFQSNGVSSVILINTNIDITKPLTLNNTYNNKARILILGVNNGVIRRVKNVSLFNKDSNNHYNFIFKDISFNESALNGYTEPIIYNYNICNSLFDSCHFNNVNYIVNAPLFMQGLLFENCVISNAIDVFTYSGAYDCNFNNCHINNIEGTVFKCNIDNSLSDKLYGDNRTSISNCTFENCNGNIIETDSVLTLSFTHNYLEKTGKLIFNAKEKNNVYRMNNISIIDNYILTTQTLANNTSLIECSNFAGDLVIRDNMIRNGFVLKATNLADNSYILVDNNDFSAMTQNIGSGFAYDPVENHTDFVHIDIRHNTTRNVKYEYYEYLGRGITLNFDSGILAKIGTSGSPSIGTTPIDYNIKLPFTISGTHYGYAICKNNDNVNVLKCKCVNDTITLRLEGTEQVTSNTEYDIYILR